MLAFTRVELKGHSAAAGCSMHTHVVQTPYKSIQRQLQSSVAIIFLMLSSQCTAHEFRESELKLEGVCAGSQRTQRWQRCSTGWMSVWRRISSPAHFAWSHPFRAGCCCPALQDPCRTLGSHRSRKRCSWNPSRLRSCGSAFCGKQSRQQKLLAWASCVNETSPGCSSRKGQVKCSQYVVLRCRAHRVGVLLCVCIKWRYSP